MSDDLLAGRAERGFTAGKSATGLHAVPTGPKPKGCADVTQDLSVQPTRSFSRLSLIYYNFTLTCDMWVYCCLSCLGCVTWICEGFSLNQFWKIFSHDLPPGHFSSLVSPLFLGDSSRSHQTFSSPPPCLPVNRLPFLVSISHLSLLHNV